jgi:predicted ATPase
MSIKRLEVQGFRSLKNVVWEPGAFNVVIGPNGSGKSNLLRLLDMLLISALGHLGRYIISEGGMTSILWDSQANEIKILFSQSVSITSNESKYMEYYLNISKFGGIGSVVENEVLSFRSGEGIEVKLLQNNVLGSPIIMSEEGKTVFATPEIVLDNAMRSETFLSKISTPFVFNRDVSEFHRSLISWRTYQDVETHRGATIRQAPVARLEDRLTSDGQNLINVLNTLYASDRNFERLINEAMIAAFGEDFDKLVFPPAADQRIQLRVRWKSLQTEQSAANLSDGTIRFLFLITALAAPKLPPVIAIDEPETGLHPSMFPIIAEYAAEASKRAQVIFTTHSDQFLDACSRFQPTVTVTKWQDGETVLKTIDGEELARWLKQYTLGALYRSGELESELVV